MSGTARREDQPAAASRPLRLIVELATDGEPIHGSVEDAGGVHPFAGWIELTATLEAARAGAEKATADGSATKANPRESPTLDHEEDER